MPTHPGLDVLLESLGELLLALDAHYPNYRQAEKHEEELGCAHLDLLLHFVDFLVIIISIR
jgi:hypothetical protein